MKQHVIEINQDKCIGCGLCAKTCAAHNIAMKEGKAQIKLDSCIKCGQCGTVCPVEARKLTVREDAAELPESMLDDYNLKSSYRLSHGMVH